jgi:hypothetical protein
VIDGRHLLDDFSDASVGVGLPDPLSVLRHEYLPAPHRPPSKLLPANSAVYVFSLSASYGSTCAAGPNRVLKVGMTGAKSTARFHYQHYLPNSNGSTLAKSLLAERLLWPYLGIRELEEGSVKAWMCANLDRDHIFVTERPELTEELERYLKRRLGPVFEG